MKIALLIIAAILCVAFLLWRKGKRVAEDEAREVEEMNYLTAASEYMAPAMQLKAQADQGDVSAQFTLGMKHFIGDGVKQDHDRAMELIQMAAEGGLGEAGLWLGDLYLDGQTVAKDHRKAAQWYRKAAHFGHSYARHKLAQLEGRPQNNND